MNGIELVDWFDVEVGRSRGAKSVVTMRCIPRVSSREYVSSRSEIRR